jgi:hemoglobin
MMVGPGETLYERVGGTEFFVGLVDRFYEGVEHEPVLRAMYPEDLSAARSHLRLFLVQYFGGPHDYDTERGEPRLRFRHLRFPIDTAARDIWVATMDAAIDGAHCEEADAAELRRYFASTATFLINRGLSIVGT